MTNPAPAWPRWALSGLSAVLLGAAGLLMFGTFMVYDDEGYMLVSIRSFLDHGNLYGQVYSQYGPFPYFFYGALHALGWPVTQFTGRLLTLLAWAACATLAAAAVQRGTRSFLAAATVLAASYGYLTIMVAEPSHPGGLIAVLTAVVALGGYLELRAGRSRRWAVLAGAGTALLLLTKINVGIFAALAQVALVAPGLPWPRGRGAVLWLLAAGAAVVPFALMRPLLHEPWVQVYASLYALGACAALVAASVRRGPAPAARDLGAGLGALALTAAIVVAYAFVRGTTPGQLLDGILLGPLRHPSRFSLVFHWRAWTLPVTLGSCAACGFLAGTRHRIGNRRVAGTIAGLRLAAVAALVAVLARTPGTLLGNQVFPGLFAGIWPFLWPLPDEGEAEIAGRRWLGFMLLGQMLHPFPVPGSQIAWGTFLALPLAGLGGWSAVSHLRDQGWGARPVVRWAGWGLAAGLALFTLRLSSDFCRQGAQYRSGRDLDLPGSGPLRLPDNSTATYRIIVGNARVHGDLLFSLPGMFSLNAWTGLPTPTLANATHWFSLLEETQQREIIAALEAHPRAVVVEQREHVRFLELHGLTPSGVLMDYVRSHFEAAFVTNGFAFLVHKGRKIAPFFTAELYRRAPGAGQAAPPEDTLLKLPVALPAGTEITSLGILRPDRNDLGALDLHPGNVRLETTPISLTGDPLGPTGASTLPLRLAGPTLLQLYFDSRQQPLPAPEPLLVLRGTGGRELALALLRGESAPARNEDQADTAGKGKAREP